MNKSTIYSPGSLITLWRIIYTSYSLGDGSHKFKNVVSILNGSGSLGGTIPLERSISLGITHGFIILTNGFINISKFSKEELIPICDDRDPSTEIIRKILYFILIQEKFSWIVFFNHEPDIFRIAIPAEWIEILEFADLLDFRDEEIIEWWGGILQEVESFNESLLKKIGDIGEYLTIEYEKVRLSKAGIKTPNIYIRWVAKIDNSQGYDVKSIIGKNVTKKVKIYEPIEIEVKSSINSDISSFRFNLTRNEWECAVQNLDSYRFHFWPGVDIEKKSCDSGPFIVPAELIIENFPKDKEKNYMWTQCRVQIDLNNL